MESNELYLLFGGSDQPNGGVDDFLGSFGSFEDAKDVIKDYDADLLEGDATWMHIGQFQGTDLIILAQYRKFDGLWYERRFEPARAALT